MSKQIIFNCGTLTVATRLLEEHRANISRVIVTCKGETAIAFYRYPEQAFNDPEYLQSIRLAGYSVNDLIIIAELLKEHKIDELKLNNYKDGLSAGYALAQKHFENAIRDSINRTLEEFKGLG